MRTLGFRTQLLLAIAAAAGLIASLRYPWYGAAPPAPEQASGVAAELPETLRTFLAGVGRALTEREGASGWDVLEGADLALSGLAAAVIVLLVLSHAAPLDQVARVLARYAGLAIFGIVGWRFVDEPGTNALLEPRFGLLVGLGCAAVLLVCVAGVSAAPLRRRRPVAAYVPPPAPAYDTNAEYGPVQY